MASNVQVKFIGDASSLTRAFGQASRSADSFSGRHPGLMRGMKLAGTAALGLAGIVGGTLAVAFKQGVRSLQEHERADARTASVIKSTGAAAQVTAGQVADYASRLEDVTSVDDVLIKQGENVLLTFTNIRNEVGAGNDIFRQATDLMVDFSVATGRDMTSAATLLGKALNDPIAGMAQLRRVGVQLTEAQKEQITAFVENGQVMEAQKVLLDALKEKYEGAGEAMGNTLTGKIQKLKNKFEEFGEKLASKVMPYATRFVDFLTDLMDSGSAGEVMAKIGDALGDLARKFGDWVGKVDWGQIASRIGEGLGRAVRAVNWGEVASVVGDVFRGLGEGLMEAFTEPVGRAYIWVLEKTAGMVSAIGDATRALSELPGDFGVFDGATESLDRAEEKINAFAQGVREQLIPGAEDAAEAQRAWNEATDKYGASVSSLVPTTKELQSVFARMGLEGLAKRLLGVKKNFNAVDVATVALTQSLGRVPTKKEIKAFLRDEEARRRLDEFISRIKNSKMTYEAKVQAVVAEAIRLFGNTKTAAEKIPKDKKTKVTAPGAVDSKNKLDDVRAAGNKIPASKKTTTSAPGSAGTAQALRDVAAAASAISRYITVTVSYVTSGRPPGAARGMTNWRGGMLMVGEQGPELVSLPRGADVYTNAETRRMMGGRSGGAVAGGGIVWTGDLIVNGHVTGPDLAETVRRELLKVGRRNLTTGLV